MPTPGPDFHKRFDMDSSFKQQNCPLSIQSRIHIWYKNGTEMLSSQEFRGWIYNINTLCHRTLSLSRTRGCICAHARVTVCFWGCGEGHRSLPWGACTIWTPHLPQHILPAKVASCHGLSQIRSFGIKHAITLQQGNNQTTIGESKFKVYTFDFFFPEYIFCLHFQL